MKQRFQVALSVNFFEIEQKQQLFLPSNPLRLPLARNTLYPFVVDTKAMQSSGTATAADKGAAPAI